MNTVLERPVAVPQLNPGKWLLAIPVVLYAWLFCHSCFTT